MKDQIKNQDTTVKDNGSILLYTYWTWGLSHNNQEELNSFDRKQLRRLIGLTR